ncbi:MAG: RNA methyltransferase, partial [Spirochaetaceae bacterium]|nr:RNA methyltransferase [Spirochaetaceae bacterium]
VLLENWGNRGPLFFLHEKEFANEKALSLHKHLAEPALDLAIMIGPEGGFSPDETNLLRENGALPIYLGDRVLRAETAAIYGMAAVSTIIRERAEWQMV